MAILIKRKIHFVFYRLISDDFESVIKLLETIPLSLRAKNKIIRKIFSDFSNKIVYNWNNLSIFALKFFALDFGETKKQNKRHAKRI